MNEVRPVEDCEVTITNISMKDDGFAIREDTGEGVYIPPPVTRAANLVVGEKRDVKVVSNYSEEESLRSRTPWVGVFVAPPEPLPSLSGDQPRVGLGSESAVLEQMERDQNDGFFTHTSQGLALDLNIRETEVRGALASLLAQGKVARADIYTGVEQRPTKTLWALDAEDFE